MARSKVAGVLSREGLRAAFRLPDEFLCKMSLAIVQENCAGRPLEHLSASQIERWARVRPSVVLEAMGLLGAGAVRDSYFQDVICGVYKGNAPDLVWENHGRLRVAASRAERYLSVATDLLRHTERLDLSRVGKDVLDFFKKEPTLRSEVVEEALWDQVPLTAAALSGSCYNSAVRLEAMDRIRDRAAELLELDPRKMLRLRDGGFGVYFASAYVRSKELQAAVAALPPSRERNAFLEYVGSIFFPHVESKPPLEREWWYSRPVPEEFEPDAALVAMARDAVAAAQAA